MLRPISRPRLARQSPVLCDQTQFHLNGASRNNGWYAGGGFDYMVHKGPLVDVILGLEYQHYDVGLQKCVLLQPAAIPATGWLTMT